MIRVVVADDHELIRRAMSELLNALTNVQVVGEAATGEESIQQAPTLKPDIVFMDIIMPGMGGLEATQRISQLDGGPAVIALTACSDPPFPAQILKAGARG